MNLCINKTVDITAVDMRTRGCCCSGNAPMLMKSDRYWQVMPNPKSLQNPVSFLITWEKKQSGVEFSEMLAQKEDMKEGRTVVIPAVAPQAGCDLDLRRSETGCTG